MNECKLRTNGKPNKILDGQCKVFFRSLIGDFLFFCFLPLFDQELSFSFVFFQSLIAKFLFSFVFFWSLIGNFLFFLLFLKRVSNSTVSDSSFLGDPTVPSSEGKDENSHPGSRFMVSWDFGSRLVEWLDMIYLRALVWLAFQG